MTFERERSTLTLIRLLLCLPLILLAVATRADSVEEIHAKSLNALVYLRDKAPESEQYLRDAAGVLVFPDIVKLGFGLGGEYGEGVLIVDGEPDGYYSTAGASFGLQLGAEFKSEVIVFVTERALQSFRARRGFHVGVDGHVSMIAPGLVSRLAAGEIEDEIVGFVYTNEGLMADLSLEGSKITRLAR